MKPSLLARTLLAVTIILLLAACNSSGESVEKSIFVAPAKVPCEGAGPQECLLIRESPDADWQLWYEPIEGLDYQEGTLYELQVEETTVENPPADASAVSLSVVEEVSATPVTVKTIYVGPEQVECEGEGPQLCYQYKENADDDWLLLYSPIVGFDYQPGYNYELLVMETPVENPPAGGSSVELSLLWVVSQDEAPPDLIGSIWRLVSLNGEPIVEGSDVVLGISEGRVGGFAGCNTYFGAFSASGNQVSLSTIGATQKACLDEAVMDQESVFLQGLEQIASYSVEEGQLTVANAAGQTIMRFEEVEPAALEGTLWELSVYNNGQNAMVSPLDGTSLTAQFEAGQMSGSAGCNSYQTAYQIDGDSLTLGPAVTTLMACAEPAGIMEQETQFLDALGQVTRYQILANRLELIGQNGATMMMFQASEE